MLSRTASQSITCVEVLTATLVPVSSQASVLKSSLNVSDTPNSEAISLAVASLVPSDTTPKVIFPVSGSTVKPPLGNGAPAV